MEAAIAGAPVAERVFPLELPGVAGWPAPAMVALPPGRFRMGAPALEADAYFDERPQHDVEISSVLAFGRHQVTFAEWDTAQAATRGLPQPADAGWGRANRPVINV